VGCKNLEKEQKNKEKIREYSREYNARPDVKERKRDYYQSKKNDPKYKAMIKKYQEKYYAKPETKKKVKEYYQEYYSNPENIERKKISRKKYEGSEKRKKIRKLYTQSEQGRERRKRYSKLYRQTPEYKEWRKLYTARPEVKKRMQIESRARQKILAKNPEYKQKIKIYRQTPEYKKLQKQWRRNNVASVLASWALRRARKRNLIPKWLNNCPVEKKRLNQIYLLSRIYANADGEKRHIDHMWPLSDGGPHWSGNLQILTATKNLEKGAYSCPKLKKQMKLNLKEAENEYARKRNSK